MRMQKLAKFCAVAVCALLAWTSSAGTFTYQKLTYSNSDTIVPGEWTCRFSKAKTYATNNNIPLVVVWANPPCSYCKRLEQALGGSSAFASWMKNRRYVMVFALGRETNASYGMTASDGSAAYSYAYTLTKRLDAYPFVAVYWKRNKSSVVKSNFVGRSGKMLVKATVGGLDKQFMESVDSLVGEYASMVTVDVAAEPEGAGTVTGGGNCFAGDIVSVTAKPKNGAIFSGWYEGKTLLSKEQSFKYEVGKADATLTAKFVTVEQDLASIALQVDGASIESEGSVVTNEVTCGVALNWPVDASAESATSVTASGLPSGLKLVKDKTTGAYTISGAPTSASSVNSRTGVVKASTVKVNVKTAAKNTKTFQMGVIVKPLPAWAMGTYNGGGEAGQATLTIAKTGKVSGKYLSDGTTWSLSAAHYETFSLEDEIGVLQVIGKKGKNAFTNEVTVGTLATDPTIGTVDAERFVAYQNLWKVEPRKTLAKAVAKAASLTFEATDLEGRTGTVKLSFGSSGTTKVKGTFTYGENSRGKPLTVSISGSGVLCATGGDSYVVYVYLAPKKGKFGGLVEKLDLMWDGTAMTVVP